MITWIYCVLDLGQFFGLMCKKNRSQLLIISVQLLKFVYPRNSLYSLKGINGLIN